MPRGYLDEMIPVNSGIIGQYISPIGPFSGPVYAMVDNDTISTSTRTRSSKPKKKKSNKPKNDGIIRNHDSVWDYKIQDGKLLTRRKSSDGKWYDITSNDEARSRIELFTNSNISRPNTVTDRQPNSRQDTTQPQVSVTAQAQPMQNVVGRSSNYIASQFIPQPIAQPNSYIQDFTNVGREGSKILSNEDLSKNNWHWGGVDDINFEGVSNDLYADAVNRAQTQGRVLLDKNGRPVSSRQVNRYVGLKDYQPADRMSVSDMALYQPQSENSTLQDVRRAQDFRRNREFDRQRNAALATMFGLPLGGIGAAEALAAGPVLAGAGYLGADVGGKLVNAATKRIYGRTWDEISDDPNVNFYAELLNPGRWIGGVAGGYAGSRLQGRMVPVQQYPSGEYEFAGDKIGNIVPRQTTTYNQRTAAMTYDPTGEVPVISQVAPGYAVELPPKTITVSPATGDPLWYDTRFMNTMRNMKANAKASTPKKRSVKTTQGQSKKVTKASNKGLTKREREKIVKAAYEQAYQ